MHDPNSIRIAQISDTHEGITKTKTLRRCLEELAKEEFDVLLHNGDYAGGVKGHKLVGSTVRLIREILPDKPFVTNIGNHDLWCRLSNKRFGRADFGGPRYLIRESDYEINYESILETFRTHNVHFLDEDGLFRFGEFVFVGASGWYQNPRATVVANDFNFLPFGFHGNETHHWMQKQALDTLYKNLDLLTEEDRTKTILFSSHFPVIKTGEDPGFDLFSWSATLGEVLQEDYGIKHFFNGHAHQLHKGPLRYESGSDYYKPRYHIVSL